jgi:hypothetical protein
MVRVAGAMATATKRVMATNGDNLGNGYGKMADGQATAATTAMGMGTTQRTWPLMLQLDREVQWWRWAMDCVCVFVCVQRPHKIWLDLKKVIASWSL